MVKSTKIFNRIISIDTLLTFDGVIPSLAEFHLKLTTLIEQFGNELVAEDKPFDECEGLCKIICGYFDRHINARYGDSQAFGQRYSLMHYFYGYTGKEDSPEQQLEQLMDTRSETIFAYAYKLLSLLIRLDGKSAELAELQTTYGERYYQWRPAGERADVIAAAQEPEPDEEDAAPQPAVKPQLVVFIIGPFATRWFKQNDGSSEVHGGNGTLWLLASDAKTLEKRLESVRGNDPGITVMAYFPIIPEGFENVSILMGQIADWQHSLSAIALPQRIPCMVAFYARLSQERFSHDQDRAVWTGQFSTRDEPREKLERTLESLIAGLAARDHGRDFYVTQRHALASTLFAWLTENKVTSLLQKLFDATPLSFAGVALSDYSNGFVRHGAWSAWLGEKYGILPGLASSIPLPPLPVVYQYPPEEEEAAETAVAPVHHDETKPARRIWPCILAAAVAAAIAAAAYLYVNRTEVRYPEFTTPGIIQHWDVNAKDLQSADGTTEGNPNLAEEAQPSYDFILSSVTPLFEHGSITLIPGSEKALEEILPVIINHPETDILIIGHSDNTGSAEINLKLSTQRALVVRDWLMAQSGLPVDRFKAEGAGSSRPIASNDTEQGRSQNRRVEIIPLSKERADQ